MRKRYQTMSNEINTGDALRAKIANFPLNVVGRVYTAGEIRTTGLAGVPASYTDNECPRIDDVTGYVYTYYWYLYTNPAYALFMSTDTGIKTLTVVSMYNTYFNGSLVSSVPKPWNMSKGPSTRSFRINANPSDNTLVVRYLGDPSVNAEDACTIQNDGMIYEVGLIHEPY